MVTLRQVQSDLKEIRYYYSKRDMFESASRCIIESGIVEKVSRYNMAMANAPPRLYEVYYALYVNGFTQAQYAEKFGCSVALAKYYNRQLCAHLVQKFQES